MVKSCTILYIPIWLYSNKGGARFNIAVDNFTFQSGYIQIACILSNPTTGKTFTFQSGYIQMHKLYSVKP